MEKKILNVGMCHQVEQVVTPEMSAARVGSGLAEVFATPMMIALVERTCLELVLPCLDEGQGTVGTLVNVAHSAATPIGMRVRCEATLQLVDRKRLVFGVQVFDECGPIGEGTHERFIVDTARFQAKANNKVKHT